MKDLINRQEAIDALGERPMVWVESDYELGARNQYDADVLAIETVPSAQPERRWIPCGVRLPKHGVVLVTYNDGEIDLLHFPTAYRAKDIIAWRPLPEPYKEDNHD